MGVLDDTSSATFADVDNDGHQDLIVVRASGPLLFRNLGNGTFQHQPEAFLAGRDLLRLSLCLVRRFAHLPHDLGDRHRCDQQHDRQE